jgi:hypothetical protein
VRGGGRRIQQRNSDAKAAKLGIEAQYHLSDLPKG